MPLPRKSTLVALLPSLEGGPQDGPELGLGLVLLLVLAAAAVGCLGSEDPGTGPDGDDGAGEDGPNTSQPPNERGDDLSWSQGPAVPTARTEVATAILEDELYVIGGFEENSQPTGVVEVLDLLEEEWRQVAGLPTPLHHARALAIDGRVHVFGGYNAIPFQATPTHLVYDPGEDNWTQGPPLPRARGGHGAAVLDGEAYLVGGVGTDGELVEQTDVYDPDNETYTQAAQLPTPRDHLGVAASEGWIHAVGGRSQSLDSNMDTHEVMRPGEGWIEAPPMPTARGGVDAAAVDGWIVVAGGEASDKTFDEVEAWHPREGGWVDWPSLPTARHGLGADGYDSRLITTAGGPEPGLTVSDALEVLGSS